MEMHEVESSWIKSIGANPVRGIMEVHLKSGVGYRYYDVPDTLLTEMLKAESMGKFFGKNIRPAGYEYEKVN